MTDNIHHVPACYCPHCDETDSPKDKPMTDAQPFPKPIKYTENDADAIAQLLVGHRIIKAELDFLDPPAPYIPWLSQEGRLTLDDGTVLYLTGNEGGCSCGSGDYPLQKVATVDNIITNARIEANPSSEEDYDGTYRIYVIADAQEINVAEFVGTDGNGYYGTGFSLTVVRPEATL